MKNVKLKENFSQVCVWPATLVGEDETHQFEEFLKDNFGVRAQFLEIILTCPDEDDDGNLVEDTGGRSDVFFAVHQEDIGKFAVARLPYGIRWIEDVYGNDQGCLYPPRVEKYRSW